MELAYYYYPWGEIHNYREYSKEDLMNPEIVEQIFDYCQILEASITKAGWKFLIEHYGFEELYKIDIKSGWLTDWLEEDSENPLSDYVELVKCEMEDSE